MSRNREVCSWMVVSLAIWGLEGGCADPGASGASAGAAGELAAARSSLVSGDLAALGLAVGPDLGTDRPILQPSSTGIEAQVASDGTNFLVAFTDLTNVHATRIDATGQMLDLDWIDFGDGGAADAQQVAPVVAFGGGHYLVVWWYFDGTTIKIRGRLVDPDGSLIGPSSFPISSGEGVAPAVAWNGQSFVVVWNGLNPTPGVRMALVSADGTVVAGLEQRVSPIDRAFFPRIAAGLTTALVAWFEPDSDSTTARIGATRVAQDGALLDPAGLVVDAGPPYQQQPDVASDGHQFLVAWQRGGSAAATIQGAVVDESGAIAVPTFPISRSTATVSRTAVAFGAGGYLVAWQVQGESNDSFVAGAAVSPSGVVAGTGDTRLGSVSARPGDPSGLAWSGAHFLLSYEGTRPPPDGGFFSVDGIDGSLIAPDLTIAADALAFSQVPNQQFSPQVVWDGADYVVSWNDERLPFPDSEARAVRISSAGVVRDPEGLALSASLPAGGHNLASNGNRRSLVSWLSKDLQGEVRSLAANGGLGPIRSLAPGAINMTPLMASSGGGFLSVFARPNPAGTRTDLFGTLLAANGNPGPLLTLRRGVDGVSGLTVAGGDYLVQFSEGGVVKIGTVNGNGRLAAPIPAPATLFSTLFAASSNRTTLLAWVTPTGEVQAQFFARGALRGPVLPIADSSDGDPPAVVFDGQRYWIVWATDRETARPMIRSVAVNGALGEVGLLFDQDCHAPALASNGQQQLLLTCYHFIDFHRPARVTTRLVDTAASVE